LGHINPTIFARGYAAALILSAITPGIAHAVDVTVGAAVNMRAVISATKGQDMNFGNIDYDPNHTGTIELGTNGALQLASGSSGISLNGGAPSAGDLTISGDGQSTIQISCENGGVLGAGGGHALPLQNVEFAVDTGRAYGAGTPCSGLASSSTTIDLASNIAPKILFGGALNVSGNAITYSGNYSTTNAGGDPVTVRVVYQ